MEGRKKVRLVDSRGKFHTVWESDATPGFLKKYGMRLQEFVNVEPLKWEQASSTEPIKAVQLPTPAAPLNTEAPDPFEEPIPRSTPDEPVTETPVAKTPIPRKPRTTKPKK